MTARSNPPRIVGLITARGGSRSIPGKNVAPVAGRPLIAWTIDAALRSEVLDAVVVSTDDENIAAVSRRYGADVPFRRPARLARDDTPHMPVVTHAIHWLEANRGWTPEYIVLLQPTSPFRTTDDIRSAIQLATERKADAVVSVCPTRHHPAISVRVDRKGRMVPLDTSSLDLRRQDLAPIYAMNGAIHLTRRRTLLEEETFYPTRTLAYVMPPERSLDIDDAWDLHAANLLLRGARKPTPVRVSQR